MSTTFFKKMGIRGTLGFETQTATYYLDDLEVKSPNLTVSHIPSPENGNDSVYNTELVK